MSTEFDIEKMVKGLKEIASGFSTIAEAINDRLEETQKLEGKVKTVKNATKTVSEMSDMSTNNSTTDKKDTVISDQELIDITKRLVLENKTNEVKQLFAKFGIKKCQECEEGDRPSLLSSMTGMLKGDK